jgi:hypothetical protein
MYPEALKLMNTFINIINNKKLVPQDLYTTIISNNEIPKNIINKIKKAYKKNKTMYGGDIIETLETLPDFICKLKHINKNCGSFGCIYGVLKDDDILKKKNILKTNNEYYFCNDSSKITTIFKIIKSNNTIINDIKFSIEEFIKTCTEDKKGNKLQFLTNMTSFTTYDNHYIQLKKNDYFGYFLKYCQGDLNMFIQSKLQDTKIINIIISKITYIIHIMNSLNFIHGDIKFDNILYAHTNNINLKFINAENIENKENINFKIYIHDFDSIATLNNITIDTPFPMFTPYCACPLYIFYRQFIKLKKITNIKKFVNYLYDDKYEMFNFYINAVIGANVGNNDVFKFISSKRDNICATIINNLLLQKLENEITDRIDIEKINVMFNILSQKNHKNYLLYIYIVSLLYPEDGIKKLIQFSDIYSIALELIYQNLKYKNDIFLQLGNFYLEQYFYFIINPIKKGGSNNNSTNNNGSNNSKFNISVTQTNIENTRIINTNNVTGTVRIISKKS